MDSQKYLLKFQKELSESCIPFWLEHGEDREKGGLLNCLDRTGQVYSTDKSVWMQGRAAWMYSRLYRQIRSDMRYLAFAKNCLEFEDKYCIDSDGRMFFTVTREGLPLRKRRYWFSETFYIMANAEYYLATGDVQRLRRAVKYFDFVYGIYRDPSSDPYHITPKTIAATRSTKSLAEPMILLNVATILAEADSENKARYESVIDDLIKDIGVFHKEEYGALLETVSSEGNLIEESSSCRIVNPGHDIECSWFLLQTAMRRNDPELVKFAEQIFNEAFERGWDKEYGGLFYFKDLFGRPVEAYEHDMKLWWPHNEAVIASLMLYRATGKEGYARIFEQVTDYAFSHFSDPAYGEWFGYLRRDGKPTEPPCKGHTYKGPFHVMRMLTEGIRMLSE